MADLIFAPIQYLDGDALPQMSRLAGFVLDEAARQGATDSKVGVSCSDDFQVDVRGGRVDTLQHTRSESVEITVWSGLRSASAHTTGFSAPAIKAAIESALLMARYTAEDPFAALASREMLAVQHPELDLFHPGAFAPEAVVDLALACEAGALAVSGAIDVDGASRGVSRNLAVHANSQGFMGRIIGSGYSASCVALAREGDDAQLGHSFNVSRLPDGLMDPHLLGAQAARKAMARLGAKGLATQRLPVLMTPEMAARLLSEFMGAITGTSQYTGNSFLRGALGERIFPEWFNLDERPHLLQALGSRAFDGDGLPTAAKYFVRNGVLESYSMGLYAARKLGLKSTGNAGGTSNLFVSPGAISHSQLLGQMHRGLLVTEMMGHGANPLTGDYSMGVSGFWVDWGEVQYPVQGITLAGNLRDIFSGIVAIAMDGNLQYGLDCGSMLIDSLSIAGH